MIISVFSVVTITIIVIIIDINIYYNYYSSYYALLLPVKHPCSLLLESIGIF